MLRIILTSCKGNLVLLFSFQHREDKLQNYFILRKWLKNTFSKEGEGQMEIIGGKKGKKTRGGGKGLFKNKKEKIFSALDFLYISLK